MLRDIQKYSCKQVHGTRRALTLCAKHVATTRTFIVMWFARRP